MCVKTQNLNIRNFYLQLIFTGRSRRLEFEQRRRQPTTNNQLTAMPVPTLDDHPITREGLHALCAAVLKTKNGEPWDVTNFNLRMKQLETFAEHTGLFDPEPGSIVDCTYGKLFKHKSPVDWIKDWVASPGDQGPGSIPTIAETVRRICALMDPDSEYLEALAQLKTVAEQQSKERSVERASKAPPYSHFLRNRARYRTVLRRLLASRQSLTIETHRQMRRRQTCRRPSMPSVIVARGYARHVAVMPIAPCTWMITWRLSRRYSS